MCCPVVGTSELWLSCFETALKENETKQKSNDAAEVLYNYCLILDVGCQPAYWLITYDKNQRRVHLKKT